MQSKIFICTLLVVACLSLNTNAEDDFDNCNNVKGDLSLHYKVCGRITCNPDGSYSAIGCGQYQCQDQIGFKEVDTSKPYPECCGGPICKSDES